MTGKIKSAVQKALFVCLTAAVALSACILFAPHGVKAAAESAPQRFSSVTGGTVEDVTQGNSVKFTATSDGSADRITFEYNGVFSAADRLDGTGGYDGVKNVFDFTLENDFNGKTFGHFVIVMEDMVNPSEQLVFTLGKLTGYGHWGMRIGYSDYHITQVGEDGLIYSELSASDPSGVFFTAYYFDLAANEYAGYNLGGAFALSTDKSFNMRFDRNEKNIYFGNATHPQNPTNIDEQKMYFLGEYVDAHKPTAKLFSSGYYKLKFQLIGVTAPTTVTFNDGLDSQTVPYISDTSALTFAADANIVTKIETALSAKIKGAMKEYAFEYTDESGLPVNMSELTDIEEAVTVFVAASSNGLSSEKVRVTVLPPYSLNDSYTSEIGSPETVFPIVDNLPTGWSYTVKMYAASDVNKQHAIAEGISAAVPDAGDYILVYTVFDADRNTDSTKEIRLSVQDKTAPVIGFSSRYEKQYSIGQELMLIAPEITDNNPSGEAEWTVKVMFGETEVTQNDGRITLLRAGVYNIIYTARDKSGNESETIFKITVEDKDETAPEITLKGEYGKEYKAGKKITLIEAEVTDNVDSSVGYEIEVLLNGSALEISDGAVTPSESGLLLITYSATDSAGNTQTYTVRINIVGSDGLPGWAIALIVIGSVVVAGGAAFGIVFFIRKRRNTKHEQK